MKFSPVPVLLLHIGLQLNGAAVRFDAASNKSTLAVRVDKAGILSAFGAGHKHGIIATEFSANICADSQTLQDARVSIRVPAAALRIDSMEARRAAGISESGPSAKDVATIQQKMLSAANLAAGEHPEIHFQSTSAQRKGDQLILRGDLTIRGRTNSVSVPLNIKQSGDSYRFSGEFQVRLTEYGITPESIGGVVKVADQISILMDVAAVPTQESCK